ncbi:FtsK/SpoIIIE domain-containing protein [Xylanimonas sp. McL0601]|uniref:FtsK/SpoIIIE domain-containing protein n=1 Tax=Xylanimonas sp. McL0601 TaxID=3414739 RepID=UPI003CEA0FBB
MIPDPRHRGGVRVTVHPGEDVLLPAGRTLAELREPLADLLRRPELRHVALRADGVELEPGSVVGERPLLPGVTLRADGGRPLGGRPTRVWSDDAAVGSPRLVARVTGTGAGELAALTTREPLVLPAGAQVRLSSRGVVRARVSPRALTTPGAALVQGLPDGRERRRRLGPIGRRWRPGEALEAGCRYELYRSGDAQVLLDLVRAGTSESSVAPASGGPGAMATLATALLPVLGSVGLAVVLRQPSVALFSLMGVLAAIPQVVGAVRRRRAAQPLAPPAAGLRQGGSDGSAVAPARLVFATLGALLAPDSAWRAALRDPGPPLAEPLADGVVAVRGPLGECRAVARAVVAGLAARGASVRVAGAGRGTWSWCRWLGGEGGAVLVVDSPTAADLEAAHAAHRAGDAVVLCLPPDGEVPSWCRAVLDVVAPPGAAPLVRRTVPGGGAKVEPLVGVGAEWAERLARRLAGARALGRDVGRLWSRPARAGVDAAPLSAGADPADPRLPAVVPLADLLPAGQADDGPRWAVPLGVDASGRTVTFDLVGDGPHLLVAGTTGAGKSELLQSFVLALALRRTPDELALALVDFKGGASFGVCADLPHVVGQVTDLDAGLAARALEGLRAELRRRKELLAAHAVADADALPPGTLPRLVVVVDEFRALADDLPDLLPGLLRVAAQGRSLGVHLVLATQRPAGAVSADVRANVSARLALRVVDVADSHDVLDSPAAARVPGGVPGRAVLRVGAAEPVALQCGYAGAAPGGGAGVVGRASAWADDDVPRVAGVGPSASAAAPVHPDRDAGPAGAGVDPLAALVARATAGASSPRWPAPWLPPLPSVVGSGELDPVPPGTLPLALGDSPPTQSRTTIRWDPATGHLAVLGRARSGRTSALGALARAALARGWHVHVLAPAPAAAELAPLAAHPGFGTLAGPDDPRRARRLLRMVQLPAEDTPPVLVLVDGVEQLRSALSTPSHDPVAAALAAGTAAFAVTAESASIGGLAARFGPRLVLLSGDAAGDVMLGAPSPLAGRGRTPGRGVWLSGGDPVECQVVRPTQCAPDDAGGARTGPASAPPRVLPLPRRVTLAELDSGPDTLPGPTWDGALEPPIGLGGDDAAPVRLDVSAGALVVGSRGSGRTAALRVLLHGLDRGAAPRRRARVLVVARDRGLLAEAAHLGVRALPPTPGTLRALLDELDELAAQGAGPEAAPPVLLLDDADTVAQTCPLETDRLAELAADGAVAVVASATILAASLAHRGLLAHLRAARTGVILSPADRGAEEVFGTALDDAVEPGAQLPGRGALVVDGAVRPVQLAGPDVRSASSPRPRAA